MRQESRVELWGAELSVLARREGALRLQLGQVLEALGRRGLCFELGFSSLSAYALERCERGARWVEGARTLARRLELLPQLRGALAHGGISWSQVELIGRVASPADESEWLERARARTVRELQVLVREAGAASSSVTEASIMAGGSCGADRVPPELASDCIACRVIACRVEEGEAPCTIRCTVDREEAWLFEATRILLDQLGVRDRSEQMEALLAEGQGTLLAMLPRGAIDPDLLDLDVFEGTSVASEHGQAEFVRLPSEVGERPRRSDGVALPNGAAVAGDCSPLIDSRSHRAAPDALAPAAGRAPAMCDGAVFEGESARQLDARVRQLARELARHELDLAQRLLQFHRAGGWRRLGYATAAQWARQALGLSRSSVSARRALAARLESLPSIKAALGAGQIGVEAALQLVRVATPGTEQAWVERARQRTIKHLREEVAAALVAMRLARSADCWPPLESELEAFMELERAVVSGRVWDEPARVATEPRAARRWRSLEAAESESRRVWWVMLASLERWLDAGIQMSAAPSVESRSTGAPGAGAPSTEPSVTIGTPAAGANGLQSRGRIELRLTVSRSTAAWWRTLEVEARRWLPQGSSWLKFLCLSFWQVWGPLSRVERAYGQIYVRDRFRCTSPVCCRRDVTPHHLQFRSAGGSDAADNVAAVCTWCHLFGIHGGRIRARGTAKRIRWELGAPGQPCLVVDGRERLAA